MLPAPYAYRCPIKHCDGNACDCSCLEVGFELFDQASVGAPAAVVVEPVLSAGGVIVPPPGYFARLLELCDEREMLTDLRRVPDRARPARDDVRLRGLRRRAGLPRAVQDARRRDPDRRGGHERDDRGRVPRARASCTSPRTCRDPLPAAAARAVLDVVREEDLPARAARQGERLLGHLRELQARHELIGDVRGMGLLCGIELVEDRETRQPAMTQGIALTSECDARGLSINLVRGGCGGRPIASGWRRR